MENNLKALGLQFFTKHANHVKTVYRGSMAPVALQSAHRSCQLFGSAHFHAVNYMRDSQREVSLRQRACNRYGTRRFHGATHWSETFLNSSSNFYGRRWRYQEIGQASKGGTDRCGQQRLKYKQTPAIILLQNHERPAGDHENNRACRHSEAQLHESADRHRHNAEPNDRHRKSCGSKPQQNRHIDPHGIPKQYTTPDSCRGERLCEAICPGSSNCAMTWDQCDIEQHVDQRGYAAPLQDKTQVFSGIQESQCGCQYRLWNTEKCH